MDEEPPTMTVGQLRDVLSSLPPDRLVVLEGCDCYGDLVQVLPEETKQKFNGFSQISEGATFVLLKRED